MRKLQFVNGEYYHIFNRGTDKRIILQEQNDVERFIQGMEEFNSIRPIGSIFENSFKKKALGSSVSKLVNFVCYCLNPNHYHFLLEQLNDRGIEKFMQKLGTGYTKYFNQKYERSGVLFQGAFKATRVESNEYLLHLSAYINLNNKIHKIDRLGSSASKSSWDEYLENKNGFCQKNIILDQFKNPLEYEEFSENALIDITERKDMKKILLE